jgi:hypothetical protein
VCVCVSVCLCVVCVLGDINDDDECRCVPADVRINEDGQIHPQISAQSTSQMQRSVQVLRSMCVVVSVCGCGCLLIVWVCASVYM